MIALLIGCDFPECEEQTVIAQHALRPMAAVATTSDRAGVTLPLSTHAFPSGWAVGEEAGIVSVLCAEHAPKAGP